MYTYPQELPAFPYEDKLSRLLIPCGSAVAADARSLYLDLAETIIDRALAWLDDNGVIIDPVEGHDNRWLGGTAARFVCPAAILLKERERTDLLEPASRALSQLTGGILKRAVTGALTGEGPAVLSLVIKELVIAYGILRDYAGNDQAEMWREALTAIDPDIAYNVTPDLMAGKRPNNYGPSACVGEWLRSRFGLADEHSWIERQLSLQMPYFTELGMYRDPGDPHLYDFVVRHNLSELLQYGYDGSMHDSLQELLRRAGLVTLQMLSPCGYAPFGGRSNLHLHNEAMLAYICEYQALQYMKQGHPEAAGCFREAAMRSIQAVVPYAKADPLRYIKNFFGPSTRHGKDKGYGEYAVYALLSASLFARTALLADNNIKSSEAAAASQGCLLNMWPAFHKVFATCGHTQVVVDTRCQKGYDATGLGRLQHKGAPPDLALSMGIAAEPNYHVHEALTGRAAAIGPCWRLMSGEWLSLAAMSEAIEDVTFTEKRVSPQEVEWSLTWSINSANTVAAANQISAITQFYKLTPGHLYIRTAVSGYYDRLGLEVPCLADNGAEEAQTRLWEQGLSVVFKGWIFKAEMPEAEACVVEDGLYANRSARYRLVRLETAAPVFEAILSISPECEGNVID
ncbi:MAG: hypothetical protein PHT73_04330 [bacterium]|nr:hypothetical protein [bacterium]